MSLPFNKKSQKILIIFVGFLILILYCNNDYINSKSKQKASSTLNVNPTSIPKLKTEFFDFTNLKIEFHSVTDKFCSITDFKGTSGQCFDKLKEFDKKIVNEVKRFNPDGTYDPCRVCDSRNGAKKTFIYHTFFHFGINDAINRRMMNLAISSFLATQNLCCAKLIVWHLNQFDIKIINETNSLFRNYITKNNLELKVFNIAELCSFRNESYSIHATSYFAQHQICVNKAFHMADLSHGREMIGFSDFVRFFVLDAIPGIYFDGDVIFLKDARILWNENFAHRWSYVDYYNTAVIGLNKHVTPSIHKIYDSIIKQSHDINGLIMYFHPIDFSRHLQRISNEPMFNFTSMFSYSRFDFILLY